MANKEGGKATYFKCDNGGEIDYSTVCDEFPDCPDGEDEFPFMNCLFYREENSLVDLSKRNADTVNNSQGGEHTMIITLLLTGLLIAVLLVIHIFVIKYFRSVAKDRSKHSVGCKTADDVSVYCLEDVMTEAAKLYRFVCDKNAADTYDPAK